MVLTRSTHTLYCVFKIYLYIDDEPGVSTRRSLRFVNKERTSLEGLTLSLQAAARMRGKLRPAKVYNANNPEHR